jgi:DNA mismatch endonuclease (patch repair protein)
MADVLTAEQRRLNMSRIRGKNTKIELLLRKALHARGLRYRLHRKDLSGRPDLVFPGRKVAVFVHGCFWHGHDCPLFKMPATRREFWAGKIARNRERDSRSVASLQAAGWRVLVIWECALRGPDRQPVQSVADEAVAFTRALAPAPAYRELAGGRLELSISAQI